MISRHVQRLSAFLAALCAAAAYAQPPAQVAGAGSGLSWSDDGQPTPAARQLIHELQHAADRGLDPEDYGADRLAASLADLAATPQADAGPRSSFDAGLTLAAGRFIADLHNGRVDPASVGHNLTVERIRLNIPDTLAHLAGSVNVAADLDALEPPFTHYALLKHELARYRALAAASGLNDLPALPPGVKSLKPGDTYAGASQLQRLLIALGDAPATDAPASPPHAPDTAASPPHAPASGAPLAAASSPEATTASVLTRPLAVALEAFQTRHGHKPDGILGASTLAELKKPLIYRVHQIEWTMERWRWLPTTLASAPILVNIPQFRLFAFESTADSESRIRQMDVIVGKAFAATQTPVFAADMTYLVFRPYWEVPYSITMKEIAPAARANPGYIDRHQMEIVRGGGDGATVMPATAENIALLGKGGLRVRQKPGPDNSLGLVKFMFPNPYDVYLHSTPARSLFKESRRDFSHGCVRVSDPVGLAQYVLRDSPEWTRDRIEAAMNGTETLTVNLVNRIRVYIVYGTALALEDGRILFFDDIYGHDRRLEAALNSRRAAALNARHDPRGR